MKHFLTRLRDALTLRAERAERCQRCGRRYATVYRVPNEVWTQIAPSKATLGKHPEHRYGGLLCVDCTWLEARRAGVSLYFDATVDDWKP